MLLALVTAARAFPIVVSPCSGPDLVITDVRYQVDRGIEWQPGEFLGPDTMSVTVWIANVDDQTVWSDFYVDYFAGLSVPPSIGQYGSQARLIDVPYLQNLGMQRLGPGREAVVIFEEPSGLGGHWVDILVDSDRFVAECDETNNHAELWVPSLDELL